MIWRDLRLVVKEVQQYPDEAEALGQAKSFARRTLGWLLANELLLVVEIYPIKAFIDALGAEPFDRVRALVSIGMMFALYVMSSIVHWFMDTRRIRFYWRVWSLLWGFGHRVEQRQSVSWHKQHSTGEKESIMTKNVAKVDFLIDETVFEALPGIIRVVLTALGVGFFVGWGYGLLALITVLVFLLMATYDNRQMTTDRKQARRQERMLERFGTEMTTNWRTLKYFGMERSRCDENQGHLDRFYFTESSRFRRLVSAFLHQEMVVNLSRTVLWCIIAIGFQPSLTSVGTSVLVLTWMERIYSNLYRLSNFQRRLNESLEPMRELVGLVLNRPEIQQPAQPQWPDLKGKIEYRAVNFSYGSSDRSAIRDFNLVAEPNQTIALVGSSGCGKTTAVELLMRSYDPDSGSILLDGIDLRQLDYDRYRREAVAIVNQDVQLFDMSVADNIRFGLPTASDDAVVTAAKQAYAHGFIETFPLGYQTQVGEDGILLSGGQKQRIAIARAFLRQPRILVLDEATSSLDAESQYYVKRAIDRLLADRTCTNFVIAHRLSTIREADWIIVLEDGRIVDRGSHAELVKRNGFYRRMCELESQGVLDER